MAPPWHLAVDFGTSNSAAAHTSPAGGSVEALALSHRSNLMPSAVFVDESGEVISGDSALLAGRRDPSRLVLSPKRFIDHDTVQLEGDDVSAQKIFGAIIQSVLERAKSQHAGTDPATVTFTHPERWSHNALGNLVDAASGTGLDIRRLRTISEPRAAAIHYAAQQRIPVGKHVVVFDFGGGTLDIAVLRAERNGDYRVVAAKGDNSLGGRTIDNLVYRWVIEQIDHDDPDLADSLRNAPASVMNSLQENIREAKEMLSDTSSATITISSPSGEKDILITRDEFNSVISQPIERATDMTRAVLREAGVEDPATPIYLTGGSSRIPYVQDELGKVGRVMRLDDPKTVVCRGALVATLRRFTQSAVAGGPKQSGDNPFGPGPRPAPGAAPGHAPRPGSGPRPAPTPTPGPRPAPRPGGQPMPPRPNFGPPGPQGQRPGFAPPQQRPQRPQGPQQRPQRPQGPQQMAAMSQRPAPSAPKKQKSNTPLLAGVGVGAVVLLIVIIIIATR